MRERVGESLCRRGSDGRRAHTQWTDREKDGDVVASRVPAWVESARGQGAEKIWSLFSGLMSSHGTSGCRRLEKQT